MAKICLFFITLLLSFCATSQSLVSANPGSGNGGQTLNVTITGTHTHFVQVSGTVTSVNFGFSQTSATSVVNSVNVVNDTVLSANVTIPANVLTGSYNVTTTNSVDGTLYLSNGFHVYGVTPPSLTLITPMSANAGQALSVTITGARTHFAQVIGNTVSFGFSQTSGTTVVQSVNVINDSSLQANITIPSNVVTGDYNVNVQNSTDGFISLLSGFHVNGMPQPSIASVNPSSAQLNQTLNVTITGANTHFAQTGTVVDFTFMQTSGTTVASFVNTINVVNDSSIIANITIPPSAVIGNYNLRVYDVTDGYLFNNFYVYGNCDSHFTTSYNSNNDQFTLTLDSTTVASAISYYWDFGDGTTSTLQTPAHLFTQDTIYNVCLKIKTSAIDSCTYCHVIGKISSGVVLKQTSGGFLLNVVLHNNTVTGISESDKADFSVLASPNPANSTVAISLNSSLELKDVMLSVYAVDGSLMLQKMMNEHSTILNVSNFANGLYFVKASSANGTKVFKLIKQ